MSDFIPFPQALKNASVVPAVPAAVSGYMDPTTVQYGDLTVRIGNGDPVTFTAAADETAAAFFARVAAAGTAVDEFGQNALAIAFTGDNTLTLSSGARLRLSGNVMANWTYRDEDVPARTAKAYETDAAVVRTGDISVDERFEAVETRLLSPFGVVRTLRRHDDYGSLVSKGATLGAVIQLIHKLPDGSNIFHFFTVGEYDGGFEFMTSVNDSPTLNPDGKDQQGRGKTVGAANAYGGGLVFYSRIGGEISFYSDDAASVAALVGSLPA